MHPSKVPKKKTNKTKTALEEQSKTPTKSPLPTAKKAHHNPPTLDTQLVENTINVRFTGDNAHTHTGLISGLYLPSQHGLSVHCAFAFTWRWNGMGKRWRKPSSSREPT
jgi:hypothetical protein